MKIYLDLQKQAITKTTDENIYQGDIYSNVFEILFYNYTDSNWFPTMSQLAPNGRKAGEFSADALNVGESHEYTEDGVTYLKFDFTMGANWVLMKGRSEFYIWFNRLGGAIVQKKCVGVVNVMIDHSTDDYFIADPTFNPNVKAYIDACVAELGDGSPKYFDTASNIANCTEDKGLAVATDTGHLYYWDETKNSTTKYTDSGLVYNDLSAYYTKSEVDSSLSLKADKTTALTHTGNQLQDYSGNNVYPNLNDGQVENKKLNNSGILYSTTNNDIETKKGFVDGEYIFRFIGCEYPQATIDESTGTITTGTGNRSFTYLLEVDDVISFTVESGYIVRCYGYDNSKAYLNRIKGDTTGQTTYTFSFASNVKYIRFSITTSSYVFPTTEQLYSNLYVSIKLSKFNYSYKKANEYTDFVDNKLYYDIKEFTSGAISTSTGAVGSGSAMVSEMIPYDRIQYISYNTTGFIIRIGFYEYDGTFIKTQQKTISSTGSICLPLDANNLGYKRPFFIRFSVWNSDYTTPTKDVINNSFKLYTSLNNNQKFVEEIPSYFKSNLNTALNTIKSNMEEVGRKGETFIFITDIHWENNAKHSPTLIKFLMENLHLNNVIFGGDLINGSTSDKSVAFNTLKNAFYSYSFLGRKLKSVFGNHDTNQANNSNTPSLWLSDNEYYAVVQKIFDEEAIYGVDDEKYFYVDVKGTKTRYICLDTGVNRTISQNQLDWCESLLQLNDDYKVIVIAHMIYKAYNDLTTNSDVDALFTLLDTYASKVMVVMCGHSHYDYNSTTTGGIPVIMVDCDGLSTHSANATVGTINEQCFDVVTVNYNNGTIKCVRIGRGNSRTITRS